MFYIPIKHIRMTTMDELKKFSFDTKKNDGKPMTMCSQNGHIAYADKDGHVFVTPFRPEIHDILAEAGYREGVFSVPFSNGGNHPEAYQWLEKIAMEENFAASCEAAIKVAEEKGIKDVDISSYCKEVQHANWGEYVRNGECTYYPIISTITCNDLSEKVGTFITFFEASRVIICDEYGRTFVVTVLGKSNQNNIVNKLIDAGYTRTPHPECYLKKNR